MIKIGRLAKLINAIDYSVSTPRDYIGASSIGGECSRQIWYEFKGEKADKIPGKIQITWLIGKLLEDMIINLLRSCGLLVYNAQGECRDIDLPYFRGHYDGFIVDYNSILEIKTANNSSFNRFKKLGCKKWDFQYYCQVQSYMGMSGINSAYILVLNKDNSEIFDENILFDKNCYESLKKKAEMIYRSEMEPDRISNNPAWYVCKNCKYRKVCHR